MGVTIIFIKVTNIWRVILAVAGKNPGFYGEKILWRTLAKECAPEEKIILKKDGVQIGERWLPLNLPILHFVPGTGIETSFDDIKESSTLLRNLIKGKNIQIDREYYRAIALYLFTTYGAIICTLIVVSKIIRLWEIDSWMRGVMSAAWLIPNAYFIIQLFIYHLTTLKAVRITHTFQEATRSEIELLMNCSSVPRVLSVIPAYMEDPRLIRNSLYSHCLQRYPQRQVVLLLGNEYHTQSDIVMDNTSENLSMLLAIKTEFERNQCLVESKICSLRREYAEHSFQKVLKELSCLYDFIITWFESKYIEISEDVDEYPTKNFLLQHTFRDQVARFRMLQAKCNNSSNATNCHLSIESHFNECLAVFNVILESFQRYKYTNAEHERTKAGNLTAYLSLLNKNWKEKEVSEGRYILVVDDELPVDHQVQYAAIFDTDTIVKPDYLIRKIAFMQRIENSKVGLVQSPYNVPVPEPTIAASASGVHSQWFLPISIGMSAFNSAFWLGFNGLFRASAIQSIEGSFIAETLIEDLENSLKILKHDYTIITSPEYQCQTFSPPDMHGMHVQRQRWASGGFRIGFIFVKDTLRGKFGKATVLEWFLRLNYILGLNILPLVVTITLLLECPYYHAFFGVETLPFFFYILTYVLCLKSSSYSLRHYLDGLAVSLFMNFHYLRGTWTSLKVLLKKESAQVFKATPRSKNTFKKALGNFEIFGMCFLIPFLLSKITLSFDKGHFWDIYPVYTLLCIFYGLWRLVIGRVIVKNV